MHAFAQQQILLISRANLINLATSLAKYVYMVARALLGASARQAKPHRLARPPLEHFHLE
eukprot:9908586-Karenia_brevis.AAC.1